jgi:hypothetical protein
MTLNLKQRYLSVLNLKFLNKGNYFVVWIIFPLFLIGCQTETNEQELQNSSSSAAKKWFESKNHTLEVLPFAEKINWDNAVISNIEAENIIEVPVTLKENTITNIIADSSYKTFMSLLFVGNHEEINREYTIVYTTKDSDFDQKRVSFDLYKLDPEYSGFITFQNAENKIIYSAEYEKGQQVRLHNYSKDGNTASRFECSYYVTVGPFTTCNGWRWVPDNSPDPGVPGFPGGGLYVPPYKDLDPCAHAAEMSTVGQNATFISAKNKILNADPNIEHSISLINTASGNIYETGMINGTRYNVEAYTKTQGAFAVMHNHPDNTPPSAGDVYAILQMYNNNNLIRTAYIFTGGETYAIVLVNPKQAKAFVTNYPADVAPGYSPEFPEPLFDLIDLAKIRGLGSSNEGRSTAINHILEKYNAGIALMKEKNGKLTPLKATEYIGDEGKTFYNNAPSPCN